jgi:hypothetical protein
MKPAKIAAITVPIVVVVVAAVIIVAVFYTTKPKAPPAVLYANNPEPLSCNELCNGGVGHAAFMAATGNNRETTFGRRPLDGYEGAFGVAVAPSPATPTTQRCACELSSEYPWTTACLTADYSGLNTACCGAYRGGLCSLVGTAWCPWSAAAGGYPSVCRFVPDPAPGPDPASTLVALGPVARPPGAASPASTPAALGPGPVPVPSPASIPGPVVYANNQSFCPAGASMTQAPFDTLVVAFGYPAQMLTEPPQGYFGALNLYDWGNSISAATAQHLRDFVSGSTNKKVFLSVGGAGNQTNLTQADLWAMYQAWAAETDTSPPRFQAMLNDWINQFANATGGVQLAGIDFDFEYFGNPGVDPTTAATVLGKLSVAAASVRPGFQVSHAPQIPYVTSNGYGGSPQLIGVYVSVLNHAGAADAITYLNVQCYNNSDFTGGTLSGATPTESWWMANSWAQLIAGTTSQVLPNGITKPLKAKWPASKLRLALPLMVADAGSGYITPDALFTSADTYAPLKGESGLAFWQIASPSGSASDIQERWTQCAAFAAANTPPALGGGGVAAAPQRHKLLATARRKWNRAKAPRM